MNRSMNVPPLGLVARILDVLMVPIMYLVSGTIREEPQRTHKWNNKKLTLNEGNHLGSEGMVHCIGLRNIRVWKVFFHIPILGGWRNYVVLEPQDDGQRWHVGWVLPNRAGGISRISLRGSVRMLLGPGDVSFFGVSEDTNTQIRIRKIGNGKIGDGSVYARIPLL